jgi:hypothetical protein
MKAFDNFSAIEDLSSDNDFQQFTGTKDEAIGYILSVYSALKNINNNGFVLSLNEPEYGEFFNPTKLAQATSSTLILMANDLEQISNNYKTPQGTWNKNAIEPFRLFAQKYYSNLKSTLYIYDKPRYDLVESLPQEYKDIYKEPFYSENLSDVEKTDMAGELRGVAVRTDLSLSDKKSLAMDIIKMYIPSLPSSSSSSMGSNDLSTTEEERAEGATTDSKINIAKYAIIGGVLIVGGIATWLILRKK